MQLPTWVMVLFWSVAFVSWTSIVFILGKISELKYSAKQMQTIIRRSDLIDAHANAWIQLCDDLLADKTIPPEVFVISISPKIADSIATASKWRDKYPEEKTN